MREAKDSKSFQRELKKNGFKLVRTKGDHLIFQKDGYTVSVPYKLNLMIQRRLRKEIITRFHTYQLF